MLFENSQKIEFFKGVGQSKFSKLLIVSCLKITSLEIIFADILDRKEVCLDRKMGFKIVAKFYFLHRGQSIIFVKNLNCLFHTLVLFGQHKLRNIAGLFSRQKISL